MFLIKDRQPIIFRRRNSLDDFELPRWRSTLDGKYIFTTHMEALDMKTELNKNETTRPTLLRPRANDQFMNSKINSISLRYLEFFHSNLELKIINHCNYFSFIIVRKTKLLWLTIGRSKLDDPRNRFQF